MKRPPYGLSFPCRVVRLRDGDTVEIEISGAFTWALRLADCWCPETRGPERERGLAAKAFAERCLRVNSEISLYVPLPGDLIAAWNDGEPMNLLKFLTFDRIPAHLYLTDDSTLNEAMVKHGYATRERQPK